MSNVIVKRGAFKDPQSKRELMDRMNSREFTGDLADLAVDRDLKMTRIRPHVMRLKFGHSGKEYDLTVHKPRMIQETHAAVPKVRAKRRAAPKKRAVGESRPDGPSQGGIH